MCSKICSLSKGHGLHDNQLHSDLSLFLLELN
jgi:hypothetical protein